jgi:hypothetical protein
MSLKPPNQIVMGKNMGQAQVASLSLSSRTSSPANTQTTGAIAH